MTQRILTIAKQLGHKPVETKPTNQLPPIRYQYVCKACQIYLSDAGAVDLNWLTQTKTVVYCPTRLAGPAELIFHNLKNAKHNVVYASDAPELPHPYRYTAEPQTIHYCAKYAAVV